MSTVELPAADGKQRLTDVATAESLLRIVQSIPSPKAEPIKLWLAKVGYERMQEMADPALSLDRARQTWQQHGRSDKWIQQRMTGQETRNKLTDYWRGHDIKEGSEFAILTNIIHQEWSGVSVNDHKKMKGLKSHNLRDHMSEAELLMFSHFATHPTPFALSLSKCPCIVGLPNGLSLYSVRPELVEGSLRVSRSGHFDKLSANGVFMTLNPKSSVIFTALAKHETHPMNEVETRAEHIDPALKAAGWGVVEGSRVLREHGITLGRLQGGGKRARAEIADYVLVYRNIKLAVIEAKAWGKPYTEGVAQAKHYATKLALRHTYATNGQAIYGIDMATGVEADVACYPSPDELWQLTFAEADAAAAAWHARFAAVPFEDKGGSWSLRYYQEIAVNRVLERVAGGACRILLTLATGTGKTSIAFQLAWKLFKARWSLARDGARQPRILFLADRNTLANQAFNDFNAFAAFDERALVRIAPDDIKKKGQVPKNGSVFFTIFQTFMSGPGGAPYFGDYPADFFDFIVIDECHRGGASDESSWRDILTYFAPAVQLGLTATPKRRDNVDTYAYFGEPVFMYSLKDGINDGFLTPFKVRQIAATLDDYVYTPDDQVVEGDIEAGKRYEEKDFNRIIEIKEREAHRVKLLMGMIDPREKTLVFCANQAHALAVRDLINQTKTNPHPLYCVRVTANDGALGDQYLEDFKDNEKTIPTILTTSQKLSTGVDARNVRNIVLMRPVNSMIEFKQIIGRGTRLYDGKDYFTIFDFVKAHHHFADPEWDGEPIEPEPTSVATGRGAAVVNTAEPPPTALLEPRPAKIKVRLADGKARTIQHMSATTFWSADGRPMSAAQFLESLFGALPEFFKDEDQLRAIWSAPDTRKALLAGLADKGFGREPLAAMQKAIDADNSDLFDVLAYVAFAAEPMTRAERAHGAKAATAGQFSDQQQAFVEFVFAQYVTQGVDELDQEKLSPLLKLKYSAIADAFEALGQPEQVRGVFVGIQKHLYAARAAH